MIKILGVAGSLRLGSHNKKLLRQAVDIASSLGAQVTIHEIADIPPYNWDVEKQGFPESVVKFRKAIEDTDLIMIATPEYNHSVPGVLKNAIDWASRPPHNTFDSKVAIIFGASDGGFGTARSQIDLRKIFVTLNTIVVPRPFVYVSYADEAFDENEKLKDQKIVQNLEKLIARGVEIAKKLSA